MVALCLGVWVQWRLQGEREQGEREREMNFYFSVFIYLLKIYVDHMTLYE